MLIQSIGPVLGLTEPQCATLRYISPALPTSRCFWRVLAAQCHARYALSVDDSRLFLPPHTLFRSLIGLTVMSSSMWPVCLVFALCCLPLMLLVERLLKKLPRLRNKKKRLLPLFSCFYAIT